MSSNQQVARTPLGQFLPGTSPNPGGRPAKVREVVELARQHTPLAIAKLVELTRKSQNEFVVLAAVKELLDRAWGKAVAPVALDVSDSTQHTAEMATLLAVLGSMSFRKDVTAIEVESEEVRDGDAN